MQKIQTLHIELLKRFIKMALDALILLSSLFVPPISFLLYKKTQTKLLQGILPNVR